MSNIKFVLYYNTYEYMRQNLCTCFIFVRTHTYAAMTIIFLLKIKNLFQFLLREESAQKNGKQKIYK